MRDVGKVFSVPVSFVQVDVQTDPRWAKTNSNIPSPGKARSVKSPTPGPTITIKFPPHALPPPPAGFKLIGALRSINARFIYRKCIKTRDDCSVQFVYDNFLNFVAAISHR